MHGGWMNVYCISQLHGESVGRMTHHVLQTCTGASRLQHCTLLHALCPTCSLMPALIIMCPPPLQVSAMLPSEQSPTISPLVQPGFVALEVIVPESTARRLLPACKRLGATGIFTYPLQTIIH